jgi:hypothetical protein
MPHHFNRRFRNASGLSKICAKTLKFFFEDQMTKIFWKNVITGDEMWVYGYDIETKLQSRHQKSPASPHPKIAGQVRLRAKAMPPPSLRLCALWICSWRSDKQDLDLAVLYLRDAVWRMQPEMRTVGSWLLHHDNAPAHTALSVWQNIRFLPFHNPPIHLSSRLPTFFYSLNSKLPLKEEDFRQLKTSSLMWRMTWRQYHKHPSNSASKSGRGALLCKGTIFEGG